MTIPSALSNVATTLTIALVLGLSSWAYRANELLTQHEAVITMIISETGGIRPSKEAIILMERINNHLGNHKDLLYAK
jgi:hypothetical protein